VFSVRPYAPGDEAGIRAVLEAALAVDRYPGITAADIERRIPRLAADPRGPPWRSRTIGSWGSSSRAATT
jgi:hypothetical protein